ncbi:ribosome recycling factor [Pontibacter ummariensis]|uniref:Ribosome-recycling factor n=1 Tax=Pontibacter ummariensis TaxID=1610492 RepID=A0A239AY46_9BACT|nr:ribosome recycling factor [Pontibacter ummariensis]PRY16178.1 ribosome recycling factor [Pontibacter ummariensis]SNS00547.1 ribosome recycling factor [Pontibacter ummariensis]
MTEEIQFYLSEAEESMQKAVQHTGSELTKIRAGKASPAMVEDLRVDYYGSPTPISQVANISAPDARTLLIRPWEKNMLGEINKAIKNSDLGLNPQQEADAIRLNIPALTEERRRDLVKQVKNETENGKISIRNIRKDVNDSLKKLQKEGTSEDAVRDAEGKVQKLTDTYIVKIDELLSKKEAEIMTV